MGRGNPIATKAPYPGNDHVFYTTAPLGQLANYETPCSAGWGDVRHKGHRVRFEHASPHDTAVGSFASPVPANLPNVEVLSTHGLWNASSLDMATPKPQSADSRPPVYPDPRPGLLPEPGQAPTLGTPHFHNAVLGNHEYPTGQLQAPGIVPHKGTPYSQPAMVVYQDSPAGQFHTPWPIPSKGTTYSQPTNTVYQEPPAGQPQTPWPVPVTGTPHLQTTMAAYRESPAGRLHAPRPIPSTGVSYLKPNYEARDVPSAGQLPVSRPVTSMETPCLQYTTPVSQGSPLDRCKHLG